MKGVLIVLSLVALILAGLFSYLLYVDFLSPEKSFIINYGYETNFSYDSSQFSPNMRFKTSQISFSIGKECTEKQRENMLYAFSTLESKTLLKFSESSTPDIIVNCGEEYQEGEYFVAGEGGPSSFIKTGKFSIIQEGRILLLKSQDCKDSDSRIELHELLHVLGFGHSDDKRSIMYNTSDCRQVLPDAIVSGLNLVYSYPSLPDLHFSNISAEKRGEYLNINFSVENQGIESSGKFSVLIKTNSGIEKKIDFESLNEGAISIFSMQNMKIPLNTKSILLSIDISQELDLNNNKAELVLNS